ncbi:putative RNA recognition motif domain, nucleotide-binding alpha-beta plait domain superfamily [Helianthus anomalus]
MMMMMDVVEEDLSELCEPFGDVVEARLVRYMETNEGRGFAFVAFRSKDDVQKTIEELHNKDFKGMGFRRSLFEYIYRLFRLEGMGRGGWAATSPAMSPGVRMRVKGMDQRDGDDGDGPRGQCSGAAPGLAVPWPSSPIPISLIDNVPKSWTDDKFRKVSEEIGLGSEVSLRAYKGGISGVGYGMPYIFAYIMINLHGKLGFRVLHGLLLCHGDFRFGEQFIIYIYWSTKLRNLYSVLDLYRCIMIRVSKIF